MTTLPDPRRPGLFEKMRETLRLAHYSRRTEEAYVGWIRRLIRFHGGRHPRTLGAEEIKAFLTFLAVERNVAASTQTRRWPRSCSSTGRCCSSTCRSSRTSRGPAPPRVPVVLSRDEVRALLAEMRGVPRLVARLMYGSGGRPLEALSVRVKDLDLERCMLTVRDGKGARDRVTVIPKALRDELRRHLRRCGSSTSGTCATAPAG